MANAGEIVQGFMKAMHEGDASGARGALADDMTFQGPFESFDAPEPYLQALGKLQHIVERIEVRKMFVDGDDVCLLYDMVTKVAGTAFIAEWYRIRGGKIAAIRVVFDPRPFAAMMGKH